MPRSDWDLVIASDPSGIVEQIMAGTLSGSGTEFLTLEERAAGADEIDFFRKTVTVGDLGMVAYGRSSSLGSVFQRLWTRVSDITFAGRTGYQFSVEGTFFFLRRFSGGVGRIIGQVANAPHYASQVVTETRVMAKGGNVQVQSRKLPAGVFTTVINAVDPTPLADGTTGFGIKSFSGSHDLDFDDAELFNT